jgi:hypothetical protein
MNPPPDNSSKEPSEGRHTPPYAARQDDAIARALQIIAEAMGTLNRQSPPIYAPQLPPYPIENMPVFDGSNVTAFLDRYEDIAKYHNFTDKMKIDRLTAHCKTKQRAIIQASEEYAEATKEDSWAILRTGLRRRFRNSDKHQQEERAEYFEHWLQQCQARNGLNIREYLQEFQIRSKRCIEAGTVEEDRRGFYLVKGLPFRQATKILERYGLRTDSPKDFQYKKIKDYLTKRLETEEEARMLNPSEAIKEFEPEVEFKVNQITDSQLKTTNPQQQVTVTTTAAQNTFRPATLQVPLRNNIPNTNRSQSPPGAAPTKNEVDGLVDKMLQLRLNHVAFEEQPWSFQFNDREAELMNNPVIQAEVRKRTEERSKDLQPYLPQQSQATRPQANSYQAQNQGQNQYQSNYGNYPRNNNQGYQNPNLRSQNFSNQGYSNANQGYQSRPLTQ